MKSHFIHKPVAVILGNAGGIGCLAAKAFASQGAIASMLYQEEHPARVIDSLPGSNHFSMSGCLNHSPDLASFAGLVHALYGRVDYLVSCGEAAVQVNGLNCTASTRVSVLLEHAFVPGAVIVHMLSGARRKRVSREGVWREEEVVEGFLSRRDVRENRVVVHWPLFQGISPARTASSACAAALFLCGSEGRHLHRECIVVNGRKAVWKLNGRTGKSLPFFKSYLEFCSACSRTVFLDA